MIAQLSLSFWLALAPRGCEDMSARYVPINKGNYSMDTADRQVEFDRKLGGAWPEGYAEYRRAWSQNPKDQLISDFPLLVDIELGATIVRVASGQVRDHAQRCDISISLQQLEGERIIRSAEEFHQVRYFFPLEIDLALRAADFRLVAIRRFPEIDEVPDLRTWGAIVVAAAGNSMDRSLRMLTG
jgi:hypothetical protein